MEQLQLAGLHVRCQKNKTIEFEQKPGESRDGVFLGLSEKYAGFAAVEDMYVTQQGMGCVMAEQGPVRFVCDKKPGRILCNGVEMTHLLEEENGGSYMGTYVVNLRPKKGKAVLEVLWSFQLFELDGVVLCLQPLYFTNVKRGQPYDI